MRNYHLLLSIALCGSLPLALVAANSSLTQVTQAAIDSFQLFLNVLGQRKSSIPPTTTSLPATGLSLIGAGFARTGTKSIEKALCGLGYKVYDTVSILEHSHERRWIEAAEDWKLRGNLTKMESLLVDMEELGYTATLDTPMNMLAPALAQLRPNAKVLLSVRDNVDAWIESFEFINRHVIHLFARPWKWFGSVSAKMVDIHRVLDICADGMLPLLLPTHPEHTYRPLGLPYYEYVHTDPNLSSSSRRQIYMDLYEKHPTRLREIVEPAERLLIFNVKQGWEPLVPFLHLNPDLAKETFPFANVRTAITIAALIMHGLALGAPLWIFATLWMFWRLFVGVLLRRCKASRPRSKIKQQ